MFDFKKYKNQLKPWLILITYAIFLVFIIMNFSSILDMAGKYLFLLTPFFYGVAIAFVLNIPMNQCEKFLKKRIPESNFFYNKIRVISICFAFFLALFIISFFMAMIIPQLVSSVASLVTNLTNLVNNAINNTDKIFAFFHLDPLDIKFDATTIESWASQLGLNWNNIAKQATSIINGTSSSLINNISNFMIALGNLCMGLMLSFYLLGSKETFIRQAKKMVASIFSYDMTQIILKVGHRANLIFNNFISGQLVEAIIIGVLEYIVMLIFGIPYSLLIACIVSIMALVPVFGPTIACIVGFLLVFSVSPIKAVIFVVIYQCTQQFENSVIYPKVVGKSVGLPGIWTLLSIVVFGGVFGIVGMILAVPFTAVVYSFGSELINETLRKKKLDVSTEKVELIEELEEAKEEEDIEEGLTK